MTTKTEYKSDLTFTVWSPTGYRTFALPCVYIDDCLKAPFIGDRLNPYMTMHV